MKLSGSTLAKFSLLTLSLSSILSEAAKADKPAPAKLSKNHFLRLLAGKEGDDGEWLRELEESCNIKDKKELQDLRKFRSFFFTEYLEGNPDAEYLEGNPDAEYLEGNPEALIDERTLRQAIDTFFNSFDTNEDGLIEFNEITVLNLGLEIEFSSMLALFRCIAGNEMKLTKGELQRAFVVGDPHFKTWQGARFDYHGECDLVLIQNPTFDNNRGLDLHIRTSQLLPAKQYSYVSDVALRIGNDVLEVNSDGSSYFNGRINNDGDFPSTMGGGFPLSKTVEKEKCFQVANNVHCTPVLIFSIQIGSSEEETIQFKVLKNMLHVDISGSPDMFEGSAGVMGTYSMDERDMDASHEMVQQ